MTIQQLKCFLAVCKHQNYTKAAAELFMTRQAIKQNISNLEQELGTALFHNIHNHLKVSSLGEILFDQASELIKQHDILMLIMMQHVKVTNPIRLGISYSLVPDFLPEFDNAIHTFKRKYPNMPIKVIKMNNDDVTQQLLQKSIDIGMVMDLGTTTENITRNKIIDFPTTICFSQHCSLWNETDIHFNDHTEFDLLLPGKGVEFSPLFAYMNACHAKINYKVYPNFYQVNYLIHESDCISFNRYIPGENTSPDTTKEILMHQLPHVAASLLHAEQSRPVYETLLNHLRQFYSTYFDKYISSLNPS